MQKSSSITQKSSFITKSTQTVKTVCLQNSKSTQTASLPETTTSINATTAIVVPSVRTVPLQPRLTVGQGTLYNERIKIVPPPEGVSIGKYCALGPNLTIMGVNHDWNYPAVQGVFYKNMFSKDHPNDYSSKARTKGKISIGNDVWIGEDVYILSGVSIGDGCCIGARSVVTRSMPAYSICAGTPCRVVSTRYKADIAQYLLELQWWDWPEEKIKANEALFMSNLNKMDLESVKSLIVSGQSNELSLEKYPETI